MHSQLAALARHRLSRRPSACSTVRILTASANLKRSRTLCGGGYFDRQGGVIGWALRWVLLSGVVTLLIVGMARFGPAFFPERAAGSGQASSAAETVPVSNTLVYPANEQGHVIVAAVINGASMRLLVDTGASLVSLTAADARAAGINRSELVFNHLVNTANGTVRVARVTLREVRIGQLSVYDVPAAVLENLNISLLGMSFLSRLQSYEMRDGKLTISW
jgi:aspartyl protease family protein